MIKKILTLKHIGLLHDGTAGTAIDFAPVTAIYADNGRGKSTFASILRACHLLDAGRLNARKTIDSQGVPELELLLPNGVRFGFNGGAWTGTPPNTVIFDSEFVEQNVYSGFEVRPDQRQSLLEFALGDQTVQLKQRVDQLTQDIEVQTRERTQAEKTLTGFAPPYTIPQFIALSPIPDAQQQIDLLQKRIDAAKSREKLTARQAPIGLQLIQFDTQSIFRVLNTELADVEEQAEAVVKEHLAKHHAAGIQDWVSRGQQYLTTEDCPFCGQTVSGIELVKAYRSYFNEAYADLKRDVAALATRIEGVLADSKIEAAVASAATNTARIEAWKDQLDLTTPTVDWDTQRNTLRNLRESLLGLVSAKLQEPLASCGTHQDAVSAAAAIANFNQALNDYNIEIVAISTTISDFKTQVSGDDTKALQSEVKKLEAVIKRQETDVVAAVTTFQTADAEKKRLESEKAQARKQIDALMKSTLQQYQSSINQLLTNFGAEFSIEQLQPSYTGSGEPRTEYGLHLRNTSVKLGSRADISTGHSFATTLSDADKRTLAFAFFIARLKSDPNLATKLVVLDDPIASLDRNRRYQSIRLIARLATECKQLVVLSHDAYFLRELRDCLSDIKPTPINPKLWGINRVQNGYSAFGACDIDDICSSDYYRHHRLVANYVDGKSTVSPREVAKAIRPLLEGYYHRRFPGRIPPRLMFGQIIAHAVDPATTGPVTNLKSLATELGEVNDFAGRFHHDTNPNADSAPVVDAELLQFARKALDLIYQNG